MPIGLKIKDTLRFLRFGPTRTRALEENLQAMSHEHERRQAAQEHALHALADRVAQADQRIATELALAAAELRRTSGEVLRDFDSLRSQLSGLRAGIDRLATTPARGDAALPPSASAAEEAFYPMLERHFRGPEALITQRLQAYREWVQRMPEGRVADLGCGRGEWLALLKAWGRHAVGVDANALVAQELRSKGLAVEEADLLSWLQSQADGTLAGVTAFQVVEHLPFGLLLRMLQEAQRTLAPGGLLILETPNPENIDVATRTFWLDPSHVKPIPPELLSVAAQHCGFREEALLRVNASANESASRDYALVARKVGA